MMRLLTITLAALAIACLGCKKEDPATAQEPAARPAAPAAKTFAVSHQTMNNPFFVDLDEGLREVIEARGDKLITLDAQFDSLKQRNDLSDVLVKGCAGIFLNPVNWEGIRGSLIQAQEKGVPVVVVDAPVKDEDLVVCTVASDNIEAGRLAAQVLVDTIGGGKVAILHHSVNKACLDRVAGFEEILGRHAAFSIVDTQEGGGTTEGGRPVMRDLLGRFPDLAAVFPINDPSALGAISAIEAAGKADQVSVVSVDGSQEAVRAVLGGRMLSTSAQFPREIGKVAAESMYAHLDGKDVEKDIKVRVELITAGNAQEFVRSE